MCRLASRERTFTAAEIRTRKSRLPNVVERRTGEHVLGNTSTQQLASLWFAQSDARSKAYIELKNLRNNKVEEEEMR